MLKLAYVGKIINIKSIEGADFIVSADVVCGEGGRWIGTVKKDEFEIGQKVEVYLQDAIVPFEFMKQHNGIVKMRKFKGVPSECLIMPLSIEEEVGTEISEVMGITKYVKELPATLGGCALGSFPTHLIPKTDEPNFQGVHYMVEKLQGQKYYATVKADGSSGTIYRNGDHFGCCSRNLELKKHEGNRGLAAVWQIANEYRLEETIPDGYAIQFEICGPGIQKNRLGFKKITPLLFNVWNVKTRNYLDAQATFDFADNYRIPTVEWVIWDQIFDITSDDQLREMAEGKYTSSNREREGIVIRPMIEQKVARNHHQTERLSFKVINLNYKG